MNDFINRYGIKHVRVSREYDRIDYDRFYSYNSPSVSYSTHREEIIEMEIPRSGFEELVNIDRKIHDWVQEERDEEYLRRQYPALKEAYDKYKMLMELYR
jgi:hypothetical protein